MIDFKDIDKLHKRGIPAAWSGARPEIPESEIVKTVTADVVVGGGGHAGLQCALTETEGGLKGAVIERHKEENMTWFGEQIGTFNSEFLTGLGFGGYDLDEIVKEFCVCGGRQVNPAIVAKYVYNSGEMLDHLLSFIPEDSTILDPDQYNIHQAYGNPKYPVVRGA